MGEDVAEDLVGRDFAASDLGEVEERLAKILSDEVAAEANGQGIAHTPEGYGRS